MDDTQLIKLKKKLKVLKKYKGQGTQLISLYLPPDVDRSSVTKQLTDEISQSSNIKSAQTRKNVQAALRRITNYLKQIDFKLPQTGLVLFSGDISTNPSKSDVTLIDIVPPKKLTSKLYWCDSTFHLTALEDMAETDDSYGIIAVDKREATIALIKGKSQEIVGHETSNVPGKTRAGGQSAHRFERLREKAAEDFLKRVCEKVNSAYLGLERLKGIVVGGPGHTKKMFLEVDRLDYRLKEKVLGTVDTSYTDESGIKEILDKAGDLLNEVGLIQERNLVNKFVGEVAKGNLATYGFKYVVDALNLGQVETVLVSSAIEWSVLKLKCDGTKEFFYKVVRDKLSVDHEITKYEAGSKECGGKPAELIEELDVFD